jgi:hypothetical protein
LNRVTRSRGPIILFFGGIHEFFARLDGWFCRYFAGGNGFACRLYTYRFRPSFPEFQRQDRDSDHHLHAHSDSDTHADLYPCVDGYVYLYIH